MASKPKPKADITFRLERDLLEEMRIAARRDSRSINSFMLAAVRRQLQELMPPQQPRKDKRK